MPTYEITAPDGKVLEITAPKGASQEDVLAYAQAQYKPQAARAKPSFANVTSGSSSTERKPWKPGASFGSQVVRNLAGPMADEAEQAMLGLGRFVDRTYRGAKQLGAESVANQTGIAALLLDKAGAKGAAGTLARSVIAPASRTSERERQLEMADRDIAAENSTPYMKAGEIAGNVASIVGPGALLRGTSAGAAFLPRTLAGNALQGGVIGSMQPVTQDGERAFNAGLGTAAGFAGAAIPQVIGAGVRGARAVLPGAVSATDKAAGRTLLSEATNPQRLTFTPSAVPGVQRTLGEATLDPGLMALENTVRSPNSGLFSQIDRANNTARMGQLSRIAGTDAEMAAAKEARDSASGSLRSRAFSEGADYTAKRESAAEAAKAEARQVAEENARLQSLGLSARVPAPSAAVNDPMSSTRSRVAEMAAKNAPRPTVQSAVSDVSRAIAKAGDDVGDLYMVRQYIGDLLSGKAGADKSYAKVASKELLEIRDLLDEQLAARAPSFPAYLSAYQGASAPINRMEMGRELIDRASATPDAVTGVRTLTPAQFSRATNDLDTVAAQATGFNKAKASSILTAEDMVSIRAIQDDLNRQMTRANTRPAGSPTQGLQEATKRMAIRSAAQALPVVGDFFKLMESHASQRVQERLAYLVANPQEAQRVLMAMQPKDRKALQLVLSGLSQGSRTAGVTVPALAE